MNVAVHKIFLFFLTVISVNSQEWSWLSGENVGNSPSSSAGPGSRSGSTSWRDTNGDVWLFGGKGFSDNGGENSRLLNDLWKYNIPTNQWTLVHPGIVSTTGILNSSAPTPRYLASSCGVTNLTFILFSGLGDKEVPVNDTWVYYFLKNRWLLLEGTNLTKKHSAESFIEDQAVVPPARGEMVSWCTYDSMYIFSGKDKDKQLLHDMWVLSLKTLQWSEMNNTSMIIKNNNTFKELPRVGATSWVGHNDSLYMFGGSNLKSTFTQHSTVGYFSDLWQFNATESSWELISGSSELGKPGVYGVLFSSSRENYPGSRQGAIGWVDSQNNLWLFGGDGMDRDSSGLLHKSKLLSDLWRFKIDSRIWTWMAGSSVGEADVKYPSKGETSREALIGGRCRSSAWKGKHNKFYIFGGIGHDKNKYDGYLNDLWSLNVNKIVNNHDSEWSFILFSLLSLVILLTLTAVTLCVRDKRKISLFKNRYDNNVKYSYLSSTPDS